MKQFDSIPRWALVICTLLPALWFAPELHAQATASTGVAAPVLIALVDELPQLHAPYAAVIIRRSEGDDLILLHAGTATPEALDSALRTLLHSRILHGDQPRQPNGQPISEMMLGVRPSPAPAEWGESNRGMVQQAFARLSTASPQTVSRFGVAPAITFVPPEPPVRARQ